MCVFVCLYLHNVKLKKQQLLATGPLCTEKMLMIERWKKGGLKVDGAPLHLQTLVGESGNNAWRAGVLEGLLGWCELTEATVRD